MSRSVCKSFITRSVATFSDIVKISKSKLRRFSSFILSGIVERLEPKYREPGAA